MNPENVPENGMVITTDLQLAPDNYHLPQGVVIAGHHVTLDGNGAILNGRSGSGRGITIENCHHVTIKNIQLRHYQHGIYVRNCQFVTIENCQIRHSAEIPANSAFLNIWRPASQAYGGAIFLWQVDQGRIHHNDLQHQMNGLLTYHCRQLDVQHNIANYCSGFGFHLFATSHSQFHHNYADFCCRYQPRGENSGHMGADAAGFLVVHGSSHNTFRQNYARLSGDGFFLAGLTPAGHHVPCNNNLFEKNDGSYSPNIAFEATFSGGNVFRNNRANYCNYGFWLGFSRNNQIEDNQIVGNRQAGIAVENGIDMVVSGNRLQDNGHGLLLWSKYVAAFAQAVPENDTSRHWQIRNNHIIHNDTGIRVAADQDHGIRALPRHNTPTCPLPHNHTIEHNTIHQNRIGIELQRVQLTTLTQNRMQDNIGDDIIER